MFLARTARSGRLGFVRFFPAISRSTSRPHALSGDIVRLRQFFSTQGATPTGAERMELLIENDQTASAGSLDALARFFPAAAKHDWSVGVTFYMATGTGPATVLCRQLLP